MNVVESRGMGRGAKKNLKQVRIYVRDADGETLAALNKGVPTLSEADLLGLIVTAGLTAFKENGCSLPLPLRFKIVPESEGKSSYRLNEPRPTAQK
jgi:hypothetical protein